MDDIKLRKINERVVVRRVEQEEKNEGGIIINENEKEKKKEGEVVEEGDGDSEEDGKMVKMDVKDGERVMLGKWQGKEVKIGGEEMMIMKE